MSGEGPPSNCSRDDDANGHEVSADDGNSNANNTLGSILDTFHAKMGRLPSLEECNDIRVQNAQRTISPKTLRNAILEWNAKNIGTSCTLGALIEEYYAKMGCLPTLAQCNDVRIQNGQRIIAASSLNNAISKWNKQHSNIKTFGALIHELYAKMGCLPTLVQCNEVRLQNGQRSSTPLTYDKEIQKWNRQHISSHSEYAESMTSIGDEESDDVVSAEVEKQVHDLTHSAAERSTRKEGHIEPISDAVKERVQRDIGVYFESNSRK